MSLVQRDRQFLRVIDGAIEQASTAAGGGLACGVRCTSCCFGPFAITQLDAWRLRQGLDELGSHDAAGAAAVRRRARAATRNQADAFPTGCVGTFETEAEEERFYQAFASAPCPALHPESGVCVPYRWRPVVCRTHGPPIRDGGDDIPHCPLCFTDASPNEIEAARMVIDVDASERSLIDVAERDTGRRDMTTVAFAIADGPATQHESGRVK